MIKYWPVIYYVNRNVYARYFMIQIRFDSFKRVAKTGVTGCMDMQGAAATDIVPSFF